MDIDILVGVQKKGISGFRELTEHLFENLNVRSLKSFDKVVKDTEVFEYLRLAFGLSEQESREVVYSLIKMGFVCVDGTFRDYRLISSNLRDEPL